MMLPTFYVTICLNVNMHNKDWKDANLGSHRAGLKEGDLTRLCKASFLARRTYVNVKNVIDFSSTNKINRRVQHQIRPEPDKYMAF